MAGYFSAEIESLADSAAGQTAHYEEQSIGDSTADDSDDIAALLDEDVAGADGAMVPPPAPAEATSMPSTGPMSGDGMAMSDLDAAEAPMAVADLGSLPLPVLVMFGLGTLLSFIGGVWFTITAFRESVWWGLATLLIPFAALVFLIKNFRQCFKPVMISIAGTLLFVGAVVVGMGAEVMQVGVGGF